MRRNHQAKNPNLAGFREFASSSYEKKATCIKINSISFNGYAYVKAYACHLYISQHCNFFLFKAFFLKTHLSIDKLDRKHGNMNKCKYRVRHFLRMSFILKCGKNYFKAISVWNSLKVETHFKNTLFLSDFNSVKERSFFQQ